MLAISYLDKAASGRIRAVGRVTRSGRSLYFSTGELLTEDGRSLATAQGAFKRASA
jgi:acyl-coenzyme A thioesterase PaaI-like protein